MRGVSFHRLAELELNDTARYYNDESDGLGQVSLDAVEKVCLSILENPQSGASIAGTIRRRLVRSFPYALAVLGRDDGIRILAVMNLKRRPATQVRGALLSVG